jgi:DNA helicase II / ATP-dependent DNA helicase PcrA
VAQLAARHVSGVVPLRDRRLPVPYGEGEAISFSASDLSTYDSCPRQYLYAALLKLQREETGAALLLGNLVHKVLETVNRNWQETGIILDDATVDSLVDEYWPRVGFDVAVQSQQMRLRAKAMIRRYLSWERSQPAGRKPVWIEQYNKVAYERHTLRGKVDVVMQNPDGSVQILDYKTGRHEAFTKSRQLFLYAHMWIAQGGSMAPGKLSTAFIALKQDSDKGFRASGEWKKEQLRSTWVSANWLSDRSEDVDALVGGIVSNEFPSNPGSACDRCRCRWMCPDG